jgi:multiple sugar transport system permease protein
MRNKRKILLKALVLIGLVLGMVFAGIPIIWVLSSSFKTDMEVFSLPPRLIPLEPTVRAYQQIMGNSDRVRFFINSYFVAMVVTVFTLVVAIMCAYSFSRYDYKLKNALNMVIVSIQAVPGFTLLIPYFALIVTLKLNNTYWALILTYMTFTLPYAILMLTGYFNTLPRELDEAVMIDGASSFTVLWRILVPISVPGLVSIGIYTFMQSWNEYLFALTLTRTIDMRTIPVGIGLMQGQYTFHWNEMMAMSVLGSLPVLILFLFFQRYFIGGMTAGSVKS